MAGRRTWSGAIEGPELRYSVLAHRAIWLIIVSPFRPQQPSGQSASASDSRYEGHVGIGTYVLGPLLISLSRRTPLSNSITARHVPSTDTSGLSDHVS